MHQLNGGILNSIVLIKSSKDAFVNTVDLFSDCNIFKVKIPSLQSFNLPAKLDSAIFGIMKNA